MDLPVIFTALFRAIQNLQVGQGRGKSGPPIEKWARGKAPRGPGEVGKWASEGGKWATAPENSFMYRRA